MLLRFTGILFVLVLASPLRAQDSRQVLIMWEDPAPIFADTALGPSQLNATAPTPGTFLYDPPAGTLLSLGYQRLCVTFVPDDTVAFDSTQKCIPLSVGIRTAADTPVLEPLISIDEYIEAAAVESSAGLIYSSGPPL